MALDETIVDRFAAAIAEKAGRKYSTAFTRPFRKRHAALLREHPQARFRHGLFSVKSEMIFYRPFNIFLVL